MHSREWNFYVCVWYLLFMDVCLSLPLFSPSCMPYICYITWNLTRSQFRTIAARCRSGFVEWQTLLFHVRVRGAYRDSHSSGYSCVHATFNTRIIEMTSSRYKFRYFYTAGEIARFQIQCIFVTKVIIAMLSLDFLPSFVYRAKFSIFFFLRSRL